MAISVIALAGVIQVTPVEATTSNTNVDSSLTLQTGSITPTADGRALLAGLMHYEDGVSGMSINQSFSLIHAIYNGGSDGSLHLGVFTALRIQTTLAAVNPTWSWTGASLGSAGLLSLIPAASDPSPLGDLRMWALGYGLGIGQLGGASGEDIPQRDIWYGTIAVFRHRTGV